MLGVLRVLLASAVGCATGFIAPARLPACGAPAPAAHPGCPPARRPPPLSLAAAAELSFEPPAGLGEV